MNGTYNPSTSIYLYLCFTHVQFHQQPFNSQAIGASLGKVTAQLSPAKGYLAFGPAKGLFFGPAKGQFLRAMATEIDPLDMLIRPPRNSFEEVDAYWSYLECTTPHCGGWLWRRHLADPTWGLKCYHCNASWREAYLQFGFSHWNPVAKRRTRLGDTVDTRWPLAKRQCHLKVLQKG